MYRRNCSVQAHPYLRYNIISLWWSSVLVISFAKGMLQRDTFFFLMSTGLHESFQVQLLFQKKSLNIKQKRISNSFPVHLSLTNLTFQGIMNRINLWTFSPHFLKFAAITLGQVLGILGKVKHLHAIEINRISTSVTKTDSNNKKPRPSQNYQVESM